MFDLLSSDHLFALERDLNTVHGALLQAGHQVASSQASRLLEQLGVKRLTPQEIINHHILPVLQSDLWKVRNDLSYFLIPTVVPDLDEHEEYSKAISSHV